MKYLNNIVALISFLALVTVASAKNYSECQGPSAHMNPKCGETSTSHTPPAPPADAVSIGGTYSVEGTTPEGNAYSGTATISGDSNSGFQVQWTIGDSQYSGTGTLTGDTLTVDWGAPEPVVYKITDGGMQLRGKWGKRGRGKEKLIRL